MTSVEEIITGSPEETQEFGAHLSRTLGPGDIVALRGDLGTGKTCMIQGICRGLGVSDVVNSPTFILINEYRGRSEGLPLPIYHFDLYRIRSLLELEEIGMEEYFRGSGICLVEWADRAGQLLPDNRREVSLEYVSESQRRITVSSS